MTLSLWPYSACTRIVFFYTNRLSKKSLFPKHRHISHYDFNVYFLVKSVQLGDHFCLDPYGGYKNDGTNVGLWSGCKAAKRQLIFSSAGNMILG